MHNRRPIINFRSKLQIEPRRLFSVSAASDESESETSVDAPAWPAATMLAELAAAAFACSSPADKRAAVEALTVLTMAPPRSLPMAAQRVPSLVQ
jgi:hypothetical protein